jgi:hypothetical protein
MEGETEKNSLLAVHYQVAHHALVSACIRKALTAVDYNRQAF